MTDAPRRCARDRRERDHEPVTAGEVARWVERNERLHEKDHREIIVMIRDSRKQIARLDDRTDHLTTRVTVIFAVVAVLWSVFLVVAPFLRALLGIPGDG